MTLYLYEQNTSKYIGEFTVKRNQNKIDAGSLIYLNGQKYTVVNSNDTTPANIKNSIQKGQGQVHGKEMLHMKFSLTVKKV